MPRPPKNTSPSLAKNLATPMVTENGLYHRSKARGLLNASNLPALQNLLKREPKAYTNEFQSQWNHFQSLLSILTSTDYLESSNNNHGHNTPVTANRFNKEQETKFKELLAFVTQLSPSYPEMTANYPNQLKNLLLNHSSNLSNDVKTSCIRSIVLLRNRDVIDSQQLLQTLFPLLPQSSPTLRSLIQSTILTDLRTSNSKSKNHRLNKHVQGLLFSIVEKGMINNNSQNGQDAGVPNGMQKRGKDGKPKGKVEALWAVRLAAELWRRGIWNDSKTISLLSFSVFHPHPSVSSTCIRFFLGDLHSSESDNRSSESEDEQSKRIPDLSAMQHARKVNKKTRSGDKKVRAAAAIRRKNQRELEQGRDDGQDFAGSSATTKGYGGENNIAAIHLLNDPQNFSEKLFDMIVRGEKRKDLSLEMKVRITQLLSRVMGTLKLTVLPFYGWINKYLVPHQPHITLLLVSLAQSVHDQTPPDVLTPLLTKISNSFIHPGVGPEVLSAGLNSIREISTRQPWSMESNLLSDLILYRSSKDKGVSNAARGLLALFREVNPALLPRRERGKSGEEKVRAGIVPKGFGETDEGVKGIQGLDLLRNYLDKKLEDGEEEQDEEDWKNWEVDEDDDDNSDGSGGWINVESDGEDDINISDSDDDSKFKKKKKEKKVKKSFADRDSDDEDQDSEEDSEEDASDSDSDDDEEEEEDGKSTKSAAKERARLRREMKKAQRNSKKGLKSRKERKLTGKDDDVDDSIDSGDEDEDADADEAVKDGEVDERKKRKEELLEKRRLELVQKEKERREELELEEQKLTELATQRILTPADFAKIHELRLTAASAAAQAGGRAGKLAAKEVEALKAQKRGRTSSNIDGDGTESSLLDEYAILGPRKKAKADYEERMKSIEKGREGRDKFGSRKGKKETESSTTNEKKKRGKNFQMVSRSWNVRNKKNASLKEKSKKLRAHIDKGKKRMK